MIKFGNIEPDSIVFLAPMAGITNRAYREFCKEFGVGVSFTEMVSDCGLIYENKETYRYLDIGEKEHPIGLQLFGGKKETLLQALKIVENRNVPYDFIDVNLGCPVPKVTKTGAGSAWLNKREELFEMMSALVKESKKPVTAKIRIGWDDKSINVKEIVTVLQKAGVCLITIHPRTRNQLYVGDARYSEIKDIKSIMKVPLVISGDIFTLESAIKWKEYTNADGIMVARGALGNPYLIKQIDTYFKTGVKLESVDLCQQLDYLDDYARRLINLKGEYVAIRELKGIATHFLKGYSGLKRFKIKMTTEMNNYEDLKNIMNEIKNFTQNV